MFPEPARPEASSESCSTGYSDQVLGGLVLQGLRRSLRLLSRRDQRVLAALVLFQFSLALLDLVAIAALGLVAALAASATTGQPSTFLPALSEALGDSPSAGEVVAVAMAAGILLVVKSGLSFWGTRRAFRFLANRQAMVASRLANELLSRPLLQVQRRSSQENAYALTAGVQAMTIGVLGHAVVIASEVALVVVLLAGLLLVDPVLTAFTAVFFTLIAVTLHVLLAKWAVRIGNQQSRYSAMAWGAVQEALRGYREVTVSGRRGVYTARFHEVVWQSARVQSERMMISTIGKYVFEISLIVGAGLLVLAQTIGNSLTEAAAVIVVFFAAASRIMPALLRLQGATLEYKVSTGAAQLSVDLIDDLAESEAADPIQLSVLERMSEESSRGYPDFSARIEVSGLTLVYPGATVPALDDVSMSVVAGSAFALAGTTGAGKSTLADVILGVLAPDRGEVRIGGLSPDQSVLRWPGAMAYIPQDVAIVNGSVRENVAMGLPAHLISDDRVWEALERSRLADFLSDHRQGLDTVVGEHGVKLSGGQRQRLGIARALYTRPRLLVMDEATSALDAETEAAVTETFESMSGDVTRVIIAHRLATIRHCDQVAYLKEGRIVACGTFSQVRDAVPDFERQAQLLGL